MYYNTIQSHGQCLLVPCLISNLDDCQLFLLFDMKQSRLFVPGLQNDHKALMKQIEEGLHKVHAQAREKKQAINNGEQPTDAGTGAHLTCGCSDTCHKNKESLLNKVTTQSS